MTTRALLIGIVWVVVQSALAPYNNYALRNSSFGGNLPLAPLVFLAFLALIVNPLARRWTTNQQLRSGELATVWVMAAVASVIPLRGLTAFLVPLLASVTYFSTPENDWEALIGRMIPDWARVTDVKAAHDFFEKPVTGHARIPWEAWLAPLAFWTAFALACFLTIYCLCVMLRRPWIERERFSFPLARVPMEFMTEPVGARRVPQLFGDARLWLGVLVPVVLHTLNALHREFPVVPVIPTVVHLARDFATQPWSALRDWPAIDFMVYPSVIGIGYLLPLEISFSFWFFFLAYKAQYVLVSALSIPIGAWTAASRQSMGSMLVIVASLAWLARGQTLDALRAVISPAWQDDSGEYLPYRWAVLGFFGGIAIAAILLIQLGVSVGIAISVMGAFLIVATVLTWMVVNGGMLIVQAPFYPTDWLMIPFGSRIVSQRSRVALALPQHAMMRVWGHLRMPHFMHAVRIAQAHRMKREHLGVMIALSVVFAIGASYAGTLWLSYQVGASNLVIGNSWFSQAAFRRVANLIGAPKPGSLTEFYSLVLGAGATVAMLHLRYRFVGFALHPIGYAVGASSAPYILWSSLFVAWGLKALVIRLGGPRVYHGWMPFFFGLIFGDYMMAGVLAVAGFVTGQGYNILPIQL